LVLEETPVADKILIACASRTGYTGGMAESIRKKLAGVFSTHLRLKNGLPC